MKTGNRCGRSICSRFPILLGFSAALYCVLAAGCGKHGKAAPVGGSSVPPSKTNLKRNVELTRAEQRPLVYYVETVGVLEAEGQTDIAAGVSGVVDEVLFREGDDVTARSVLVKVDQRRYVSAAKLAEANVQRAEANLNLARDVFRRVQQAGQGASGEEKSKASLGLSVVEAELNSAKAAHEMAKNNLDRSQVRAPYDGRINRRNVTPGTYLEEKTMIATIADLTRLRLVGYIPETAAPTIRDLLVQRSGRCEATQRILPFVGFLNGPIPWGTVAAQLLIERKEVPSGYDPEFVLVAHPRRTFLGRMFYVSTVASPDTHMFEFKAEVDQRDRSLELRPGYTARIRIPLRSNRDACVVPEESVRASERGFIAFVPVQRKGRDGQTEWIAKARTLELGYRAPGWVEVQQGIVPGEVIVRRGAEALEDGTPIRFPDATP